MRRFEYTEGTSNKFWEITVSADTVTTRWGRIDTDGQLKSKTFDTHAAAGKEADKQIQGKTKKGYVEVGSEPAQGMANKATLDEEMKAAVENYRDLLNQWSLLDDDEEHDQVLGPPCTAAELDEVAQKLGAKLPPSYAAFLALHNGWTSFEAGAEILSVQERNESWVDERIEIWDEQLGEFFDSFGFENVEEAWAFTDDKFLILLDRDGYDVVFLDTTTQRPDGEMDVVHFDMIDGEIDRYPNFVALLNGQAEVVKNIISEL